MNLSLKSHRRKPGSLHSSLWIVKISLLQKVMPGSRSSDLGSNLHMVVAVVPGVGRSAAGALATNARAVVTVAVRRRTLFTGWFRSYA